MEQGKTQKFRIIIKIFRFWKKVRDKFAAALDVNSERKVELYVEISKSATLRDIVYWLQLLFSAGIATLGLVLNSTAVIIGAMLISPLMGPILSAGLALATGDLILAIRSAVNLLLSTFGAILFALILVAFLPFKDITSEINARIEPNTLDLVIALFSGAIGSIATCRKVRGVVTSIPGVAIAVALMPPICVVGFGFGYGVSVDFSRGLEIAKGGGLLYLTNLVAITFTAMIVFVLLRIDTGKVREKVQLWRETERENVYWQNLISKIPTLERARKIRSFLLRLLMILLPLLLIFIPLSQSFSKLRSEITERQTEFRIQNSARKIWEDVLEQPDKTQPPRSDLDELRVDVKNDGKVEIYLRVFTDKPYNQAEKEKYQALVAQKLGKKENDIELQLVEIPTSARNEDAIVVNATPIPLTVAETQIRYLESVRSNLDKLKLPNPALLIDYDVVNKPNNWVEIHIYYLSQRDIEDDGKSLLLEDARRRLNLQNLSLFYTRISSEIQSVVFQKNSLEFETETIEKLNQIGQTLLEHPSLRMRIWLKKSEKEGSLEEEKAKKIKEFLMKNFSLAEEKLVFDKTEDSEKAEIFQIFIKQ